MRTSSWTNQRDPKSISSLPPVIWSACCLHLPARRHPFCAYRRSNSKSWSPAFAAHSSLATVQCMTVSSVFLCSCSAPYVWYAWAFCQVMSLREVCVQFSKAVSMVRFIRGCNTLSYRNRFFSISDGRRCSIFPGFLLLVISGFLMTSVLPLSYSYRGGRQCCDECERCFALLKISQQELQHT